MADSMCGPSNASKSFLAHATQDRSLHQDRIANAPQAGPSGSFRNASTTHANASEMGFDSFQQQQGVPIAPFEMAPHGMLPAAPIQHHAPQHAATRLESPATGGIGHFWVNQFAELQVGNAPATAPIVTPHASSPAMNFLPVTAPVMPGMAMGGMGMSHFASAPFGFRSQFASPGLAQGPAPFTALAMAQTETPPSTAEAHTETAEVRDAFEDLFGQYEAEAEANHETYMEDFEQAQATWMAEHGPQVLPPTTQEMAEIDEQLELNAAKQDTDHELAKAAGDILQAVSLNSSDKFKHSNFLELMRRIASHEVVINNDNFVDIKSGDVVNTNELMPEIVLADDAKPGDADIATAVNA